MKNQKYILLLLMLIIASACASTKEASNNRELEKTARQEEIRKMLESGKYLINVDKLFSKRSYGLDLRPSQNYILVENGTARINLAYVGRSFSTRPISAINVRGKIESMTITPKKNGSSLAAMRVVGGGERFNLFVRISSSGYCSININNGRLDNVTYRGRLTTNL